MRQTVRWNVSKAFGVIPIAETVPRIVKWKIVIGEHVEVDCKSDGLHWRSPTQRERELIIGSTR
jgi:hypothetical protein